ncbi:MAG TPA: DUF5647 family protein [Candidatus Limnocylindria bacterium]|nr:DUF5647 family protein [Candidatus Limnocylindria bacterium]
MTPEEREMARRNIELALSVAREAMEDEEMADQLTAYSVEGGLVLSDASDPEQSAASDELAETLEQRGYPVTRVEVRRHVSIGKLAL